MDKPLFLGIILETLLVLIGMLFNMEIMSFAAMFWIIFLAVYGMVKE